MPPTLQLLAGAWPEESGLDTALSKIILDRVSAGKMPATLRLYVPGREVAFGKRDTISDRYPAAVAAADAVGFAAVERLAGGRAAVFTEHTLAFSLALPESDPRVTIHSRFREVSETVVAAFARVGVNSEVGEIMGEYCPGRFSVHHDRRIKLMGIGQRLAKHAAHIGGVIAVDRTDLLLRALIPVYRALDLQWRPATAGSLGDVRHISNAEVLAALKAEFGERYEVKKGRIESDLVEEARSIATDYLPARNEE
ncbi:MAG: lipoate--protein ligase family protein [Acidimicrobiia bacterium]|nr:lipoate--protein ligase family protein [Acidimicrobiia bacterium]